MPITNAYAMRATAEAGGDLPHDHTINLPDDCLAVIFDSLGARDREKCSFVCRRWLDVEARSRRRLVLKSCASLIQAAPSFLARFDSVSSLSLCDRGSDCIDDDALDLIARRWPALASLTLRSCHRVTDLGMASVASRCPKLRRVSISSCSFGAAGIDAVLRGCSFLADFSVKRLRGLRKPPGTVTLEAPSAALRSICLEDLHSAQCFAPLIAGCAGLKTLKIVRCYGEWDDFIEEIASKGSKITEVHLEKIKISDCGLLALSSCLSMEVLHLFKTPECTDAGIMVIADRCCHLRKIHIDGWMMNQIGDYGLMAIAKGCPKLQELVLIGINPTVLSLQYIGSSCRGLVRLDLHLCASVGDAELCCIAAKFTALNKLRIRGCPVSDLGLQAIAKGCPNLTKIKVKRCLGVTAKGLDWLRFARGGLLDVSASENGMPKSSLEAALP